jgi:hypothetical protein
VRGRLEVGQVVAPEGGAQGGGRRQCLRTDLVDRKRGMDGGSGAWDTIGENQSVRVHLGQSGGRKMDKVQGGVGKTDMHES